MHEVSCSSATSASLLLHASPTLVVSMFRRCSRNLLRKTPMREFQSWLSDYRTRLGSMRLWVQSLSSLSGLRIQCCHELWCRSQTWPGSVLPWLWRRPATIIPIQPLTWEPPYAAGTALKKQKLKIPMRQACHWGVTRMAGNLKTTCSPPAMLNFMCQLDWVNGCPDR